MIKNIKNFLTNIKSNYSFCKEWLKTNGMVKIIGGASCVGLLTFSSWSSLFLAILIGFAYKMITHKIPENYLSVINIDFKKYLVNVIIGLVIASIFLFIV